MMSESLPSPCCFPQSAPSLVDGKRLCHLSQLLFEASFATLVFAWIQTTILEAEVYSPNHVSTDLGIAFIAPISILALAIGIYSSAQQITLCTVIWRVVYHAPFLAVTYTGFKVSLALQGPFTDPEVVAPLAGALASLGLYVGITGFEATVDLIWKNAISAAAQTDDPEAGLVAIHIICWWVAKGVSAVGLRLSSLGKICFILPPELTQYRQVPQVDSPAEKSYDSVQSLV